MGNDGRNLKSRLIDDMQAHCLGTVNRYCTVVVVWNPMLDTQHGSQFNGGCQSCFWADINVYTIRLSCNFIIMIGQFSCREAWSCARVDNTIWHDGIEFLCFKIRMHLRHCTVATIPIFKGNLSVGDGNEKYKTCLGPYSVIPARWK